MQVVIKKYSNENDNDSGNGKDRVNAKNNNKK